MQFRRSGQRDDRRRRVLLDDAADDSAKQHAAGQTRAKTGRNYSSAVHSAEQLRVIDIVPSRLWVLGFLVVSALIAVGALSYLNSRTPDWSQRLPAGDLAAFDVTQPASLGGWFSSTLLLLAAITSLQVFALRRHKTDDYRGRYRIWLWVAAMLTLASIDATARLDLLVRGLMINATGNSLYGDGMMWSVIVCGSPMALLAICLLFEMRRSRWALALLLSAGGAYVAGTLISLGVLPPVAGLGASVLSAHCFLVGHAMVLNSVWTYARHVYLEAHSETEATEQASAAQQKKPQAAQKTTKPTTTREPAATKDEAVAAQINMQLDHEQLAKVEDQLLQEETRGLGRRKSRREKQQADVVHIMDDEHDEQGSRRLSKRERREIKRQRRQRKAA